MIASSGIGSLACGDHLIHHVPHSQAAGVILHPARLKRGILAAVGEDDQLFVPVRGGVDHRLREAVNVRHGDRPDRLGRFDAATADGERLRIARWATRNRRPERQQGSSGS